MYAYIVNQTFEDIVGGVTEILQTQINSDNNKSKFVFMITDMRYENI